MAAREFEKPLFGLVAENDNEIPFEELTGIVDSFSQRRTRNTVTLGQLLTTILILKVLPHPTITEDRKWESQPDYLIQ